MNLKYAFHNMNIQELRKLMANFYLYLSSLIIEIIKMQTISKKFLNKRVKIVNPELLNNYAQKNQTIILLSGHFNNWEWAGQKISLLANQRFISIYKPLNNEIFDNIIEKMRTRFGAVLVSIQESMRYILKTKKETQIIALIADQNPVVNSSTSWHVFFDREVPVFTGAEKIARKMNYPVVFCDMKQIDSGMYTITLETLTENPEETNDGEITKIYFDRLESQIKKNPSQWLWSHRRWKHKK